MQTRRDFLKTSTLALGAGCLTAFGLRSAAHAAPDRPNVILIITDDQGYGDIGRHGNGQIDTPILDKLYDESIRFTQCHMCPVCAPTRASLMTGRYNYRTGAIDTYLGRAMMYPGEVTLPEMLGESGYETAIFGKWHLGDNYPLRPNEQGFQEALVHNGGGMQQPSDPENFERNNTYFDPVLQHNGQAEKHPGYCTDIFANAAIDFIEHNKDNPFFVYFSTNTPHFPVQVEDRYVKPYLDKGLSEVTAGVYGMITNLDENLGRLFTKVGELGLEDNTLVIFITDNGASPGRAKDRFNAGMRGWKGTVYQGGVRVPCFVKWPAKLTPGKDIDRISAHIDLLPTILDACGVPIPENVKLDGISLLPLMTGEAPQWPDRTLFFQWHRGDEPELYNSCAARNQRYKLVNGKELYDLEADPGEKKDIAADHPDIVAQLRAEYEAWFKDVGSTRGYAPQPILVGTPHENPVVLTRQDWRGQEGWSDKHVGHWEVKVTRKANYDITLEFPKTTGPTQACFRFGQVQRTREIGPGITRCTFGAVPLPATDGRLEAYIEVDGTPAGSRYVTVKRL